jgi:diaminopimelate epimerase
MTAKSPIKIPFSKYQGTGNDFIIIDNREFQMVLTKPIISKWCDRRFGIGADGLILISNHPEYDFEMTYYNSDGSQSMCGNGSRCAVHFAKELGIINTETTFLSTDGVHHASLSEGLVKLSLHNVPSINKKDDGYFVNTGSPHHIKIVPDVSKVDIIGSGSVIRYSEAYKPDGTNVNFVELDGGKIRVRTYERGVEAETLSCGTGVTAAALTASIHNFESPVAIETLGGSLSVSFTKSDVGFENIYLIGPAERVYDGCINYIQQLQTQFLG